MTRGTIFLLLALAGCGGAVPANSSPSGLQVRAISANATPLPSPPISVTAAAGTPVPAPPPPTPTLGAVAFTLDFTAERRDDVTLHVGQALQLKLTSGPTGDWVSGVDDARVLRPMAPAGNGIFQALTPGSTLLTAHVPYGCANVVPAVPCKNPERGLWFQTRVYVVS